MSNVVAFSQPIDQDPRPAEAKESEMAILGWLILQPASIWRIMEECTEWDFHKPAHRLIFKAAVEVVGRLGAVDLPSLTDYLRESGNLKKAGGIEYLAALAHHVPAQTDLGIHIHQVRQKALMRSLMNLSSEAVQATQKPGAELPAIMDRIQEGLTEIAHSGPDLSRYERIDRIAAQVMASAEQSHRSPTDLAGISTGFPDLDEMIVGLTPGMYVILAGRPSMGKTAFGLRVATNVARQGYPVGLISLEQPKDELVQRILCSEAKVGLQKFRRSTLDRGDWMDLGAAASELEKLPIYIEHCGQLNPSTLRAKVARLAREQKIKLLLLDYLQLMDDPNRENRAQAVGAISRTCKLLANEYGLAVVALSQLSRKVEERANKRPILSDLRESGDLEQDADLIGFLYREEYYRKMEGKPIPKEIEGRSELIIGKQRNGPTGVVELKFDGRYARFDTWTGA